MINLDKFIKGEIAYIVTKHTIDDFLNTLESCTEIVWCSECKPTEFVPSEVLLSDVRISIECVHMNEPVLVYSDNDKDCDFKNYKVEVFKC